VRVHQERLIPVRVEEPALEDEAGGGRGAVVGDVQAVRKLVRLHLPLWGKETGGRCYDRNFLRISTIFDGKMALFSKRNVMIIFYLHNLAMFSVKNAMGGEKIFLISYHRSLGWGQSQNFDYFIGKIQLTNL
jgi:hypothetical protein